MTTDKIKVYISAGWFDKFQEEALTYLEEVLFNNEKFEVFSPRKEIIVKPNEPIEKQSEVFDQNIEMISKSDLIISSTVGKDLGTSFENGVAYQMGKKIIYTFFDERFQNAKFNIMLSQSGIACFTDKLEFVSFLKKLTKENLTSMKQDYRGLIE